MLDSAPNDVRDRAILFFSHSLELGEKGGRDS